MLRWPPRVLPPRDSATWPMRSDLLQPHLRLRAGPGQGGPSLAERGRAGLVRSQGPAAGCHAVPSKAPVPIPLVGPGPNEAELESLIGREATTSSRCVRRFVGCMKPATLIGGDVTIDASLPLGVSRPSPAEARPRGAGCGFPKPGSHALGKVPFLFVHRLGPPPAPPAPVIKGRLPCSQKPPPRPSPRSALATKDSSLPKNSFQQSVRCLPSFQPRLAQQQAGFVLPYAACTL